MKTALLTVLLSLALIPTAEASFTVGIAEPGADRIPSAEVSALGLGAERRTVVWRGEVSFAGRLDWTPGLRHFLAVSSGWPASVVPVDEAGRSRFCGFLGSVLARYPAVSDVILWNEPNLAGFWGQGADAYAQLLEACSPLIRAHGDRVWAPGMSPSTTAGVADFARRIAARGPHLIDGWDQHDYDGFVPLQARIRAMRTAFGWRVPVLVGESGATTAAGTAYLIRNAYCAGAIGWLNFKLRDDGDWKPTGLEWSDGTRKPQFTALVAEAAKIRSGRESCGQAAPPPPEPQGDPKPLRSAFRSSHSKRWICPQRPDGTPVASRKVCIPERWPS